MVVFFFPGRVPAACLAFFLFSEDGWAGFLLFFFGGVGGSFRQFFPGHQTGAETRMRQPFVASPLSPPPPAVAKRLLPSSKMTIAISIPSLDGIQLLRASAATRILFPPPRSATASKGFSYVGRRRILRRPFLFLSSFRCARA